MTQWCSGDSYDKEELADDLEQLAQGIREGKIGEIQTDVQDWVPTHGVAEREVLLEFVPSREYSDVLQPSHSFDDE